MFPRGEGENFFLDIPFYRITYKANFESEAPGKEFFNISKYAGPVNVFAVMNFVHR